MSNYSFKPELNVFICLFIHFNDILLINLSIKPSICLVKLSLIGHACLFNVCLLGVWCSNHVCRHMHSVCSSPTDYAHVCFQHSCIPVCFSPACVKESVRRPPWCLIPSGGDAGSMCVRTCKHPGT